MGGSIGFPVLLTIHYLYLKENLSLMCPFLVGEEVNFSVPVPHYSFTKRKKFGEKSDSGFGLLSNLGPRDLMDSERFAVRFFWTTFKGEFKAPLSESISL